MNNPFWDFSLLAYQQESVSDLCMRLQDECGLDVNLLLYAAWQADCGVRLDRQHVLQIETLIAPWRERVVVPLRGLRQGLRDYPPAAGFRERIKGLELESEHRQQEIMCRFSEGRKYVVEAGNWLRQNLSQVGEETAIEGSEYEVMLDQLAAALGR
ncbi:MAG: TIGR02444 family protein [Pseudomonadota bacterium]